MPQTFGHLLIELEALKKEQPELLKSTLVFRNPEGDDFVELAVTLPGRQLILVNALEENGNGS